MFIGNFHPGIITRDSSGQGRSKVGVAPSIFLCKFLMENEKCEEEKSLHRIVDSPEGTQYDYDYEMKERD